jgi:Domain of unknown function (DUF4351)
MQEYDIALKLLLQGSATLTMQQLTGTAIHRWLNVELPEVRNLRVDLLGEAKDQTLIHLELQSTNDPAMPLRMAEYCLRVWRQFKRFPRQVLLYVGEPAFAMDCELRGPDVWFRYRAVDIRDLNGQQLLESPEVGDNVIALLTRLRDQEEAVRHIVSRVASLGPGERETTLVQLLILAGLRRLEDKVEQEARKMPILNNILDHKVLGREFKKGELTVLRRQLEKRFGPLPAWAEERLASYSASELEDLSLSVLAAQSLPDLLK